MKARHILGVALLLVGSVSYADGDITWDDLDAPQQEVLAQFAEE